MGYGWTHVLSTQVASGSQRLSPPLHSLCLWNYCRWKPGVFWFGSGLPTLSLPCEVGAGLYSTPAKKR